MLELTSIAAGLELRRNRRLGKSVAFPATLLTVAVFLSLSTQVVKAQASVIGWIAAALPALGFLAMVKIALGRADPAAPARTESGPAPATDAAVRDGHEMVPEPSASVQTSAAAVQDRATAVPASADQRLAIPDWRAGNGPAGDRGPELAALVPAARTAARALAVQGTALSRTALAHHLRANGHQLSNATASALVRVLRAETTPAHQRAPDPSQRAPA